MKTLNFRYLILTLVTLLSVHTHAQKAGPGHGGGGGGIEINGKIYTMAQAGLRIPDAKEDPFFFGQKTVEATNAILDKLEAVLPSSKKTLRESIFTNDHRYIKATVIDPALFKKMAAEYQAYIASTPLKGKFVLAAFTDYSAGTTYLFPDFFKATTDTQAIYLIHEASFFKNRGISLQEVLRTEIAVVRYLENPSDIDRLIPLYDSISNPKDKAWINDKEFLHTDALYFNVLYLQNIKVGLENFAPADQPLNQAINNYKETDFVVGLSNSLSFPTDPIVLSEKKSIHPYFLKRFFRKKVTIHIFDCLSDGASRCLYDLYKQPLSNFEIVSPALGVEILLIDKRTGNSVGTVWFSN